MASFSFSFPPLQLIVLWVSLSCIISLYVAVCNYLHCCIFWKLINYIFPNLSVSLYHPIVKLFCPNHFYDHILSMTAFIIFCITCTLRMIWLSSPLSSNDTASNCTTFSTSSISSLMLSGLFFSSIPLSPSSFVYSIVNEFKYHTVESFMYIRCPLSL